jgi:hypothetical protein
MFKRNASPPDGAPTDDSRMVAIMANNRIIEVWDIHRQRTEYRERATDLPAEIQARVVDGRQERREVHRTQLARQEWGHFIIRRHQATRMLRWAPTIGLTMLIPGTLLAAGSANLGIAQVPLSLLILQCTLITIGGLMAISAGWRVITRRVQPSNGIPLESLGVSSRALGLPNGALVLEPLPVGCRASRFKGEIEVDAPAGSWTVVEEFNSDFGWYRAC